MKRREEKQEWAGRKVRLQCRFNKAPVNSRGALEWVWTVKCLWVRQKWLDRDILPCSVTWCGLPRKGIPLGEAILRSWGRPWRIWHLVAIRSVCCSYFSQLGQQNLPWSGIWETHLLVFQSPPFAPLRSTFHICSESGSFKIAGGLSSRGKI